MFRHHLAHHGHRPAAGTSRRQPSADPGQSVPEAGILDENGIDRHTHAGTPQGGILSPLLANLALSVLDDHYDAIWNSHRNEWTRRRHRQRGGATYHLVRYADDFVIMVNGGRDHAEALRDTTSRVLATVGLRLAPAKTQVVHLDEGFDFLGFRIQRHRQWGSTRYYVYSYPSTKAVTTVRRKVKTLTGKHTTNHTADVVFQRLGHVTRGWCHYFRHAASATTFSDLHNYLWCRVRTWLRKKHPKHTWKWIVRRYYQPGWWPKTHGVELHKPATVKIQRHRYRGKHIPTPWTHTTTTTTT